MSSVGESGHHPGTELLFLLLLCRASGRSICRSCTTCLSPAPWASQPGSCCSWPPRAMGPATDAPCGSEWTADRCGALRGGGGSGARGSWGLWGQPSPAAQVSQSSTPTGVRGADVHSAARAPVPELHTRAQRPPAADTVGRGQAGPAGQPRRAPVVMDIHAFVHAFIQPFLEIGWRQGAGGIRFRLPSEPQSLHLEIGIALLSLAQPHAPGTVTHSPFPEPPCGLSAGP